MAATLSSWIWGMIFLWANHFMCYSWFVMFPWGTMMQCNWRKGKTEVYQRCRPPRLNQSRPLYNQMLGVFRKVFSACPRTEISFLCVFQGICRWNENHHKQTPHIRGCPTAPRRGWSRWPHTSRCLAACGPTIRKRTATNKNHWGHSQDGLVQTAGKPTADYILGFQPFVFAGWCKGTLP